VRNLEKKITVANVKEGIEEDKRKAAAKNSQPQPAEKPKKETKKETKKAPEKKNTPATFPASIRINDYGFIGLKKGLLEALGWHKGMSLRIDKNPDGSATLRKA
jgi:hypothetical protein